MRSRACILTAFLALFMTAAPALAGDDLSSSPLGKELVNLGMKFLDNPGDFFFNLHSNNEDYSPLPGDRRGSVRFNFFPTFLPVTWGNLAMKYNVKRESARMPQIDLAGSYGDLLALRAVSAGDVKPSFIDYSAGIVASKAVDSRVRLFGGAKYSVVNMDVEFSTPVVSGEFRMDELKFQVADTFIFTGIAHQPTPTKTIVAQVGYGFRYRKIISRVAVSHKHLELGMDIFPEGLFVVHPFLAWHWYF